MKLIFNLFLLTFTEAWVMRDFKYEIDHSEEANQLRDILADLAAEIDDLEALPYEEDSHLDRIHDLELVLRYGEHKLERLLA